MKQMVFVGDRTVGEVLGSHLVCNIPGVTVLLRSGIEEGKSFLALCSYMGGTHFRMTQEALKPGILAEPYGFDSARLESILISPPRR